MLRTNNAKSFGNGCGCLALTILLVNLTLGGLATEYVVEYWVPVFSGNAMPALAFWKYALAGLFLGEFTVPLAVFTLILGPVIVPLLL